MSTSVRQRGSTSWCCCISSSTLLSHQIWSWGAQSAHLSDQNDTENQTTSPMSSSRIINLLLVAAFIVGGVVTPAFLFLYGDRGPHDNTYALFIPIDMAVIIALCVLGVIIPVACGFWTRRHTAQKFNTKRKAKNSKDTKLQRLRQKLRDGLYIELHKRPTIPQLMEIAREFLSSLPPPAHEYDQHADGREEEKENSLEKYRNIGPGCLVKEGEIRSYYKSTRDNDNTDDKVVFVLRLALGLLATGHCTVDVETTILKTAAVLELASPRVSVGHRLLQAQFMGCVACRSYQWLAFRNLCDTCPIYIRSRFFCRPRSNR